MTIAFFDMDKTLLSKSSGMLYVKYLWKRRLISLREMLATAWISAQYTVNVLDFPKAMARLSRNIRDGDAVAAKVLCDQWVRDDVLRYIAPKALTRIREHQASGHVVWLLSASTQFAVAPVAEHLKIPCSFTELEIVNGHFTGQILGVDCYGEGKRVWGERVAAQLGADLNECVFYTDSFSDRPFLDVVGHPVAVNPDRALRSYAATRGWPIEYFY